VWLKYERNKKNRSLKRITGTGTSQLGNLEDRLWKFGHVEHKDAEWVEQCTTKETENLDKRD